MKIDYAIELLKTNLNYNEVEMQHVGNKSNGRCLIHKKRAEQLKNALKILSNEREGLENVSV